MGGGVSGSAIERLDLDRIVPVLTFEREDEALRTCELLYECGFRSFELTLRTDSAFPVIESVLKHLPHDAQVGAGTIRTADQVEKARDIGCAFGVSPGLVPAVAETALDTNWPYMPAVATVSEIYRAHEMGFTRLKLFPAEGVGGVRFLKAVAPVTDGIRFCPTGGVNERNVEAYLGQRNVFCVGGSWIVSRDETGAVDLQETRVRAAAAVSMMRNSDNGA